MKKSVSNILVKDFLTLLKNSGVNNTIQIMESCGISQYELDKNAVRISEKSHFKLITEVSKHSKAISETTKSSFNKYDILDAAYHSFPDFIGYTLNQSSIIKAVNAYIENRFIIADCDSITLTRNDDKLKLTYSNEDQHLSEDFFAVCNFLILHKIACRYGLTGNIEVGFTGTHADDGAFIKDCFETKCKFNSRENFIVLNTKTSDKNSLHYNSHLNILQKNDLDKKRASIYCKNAFESTVSAIIEKRVHEYGMIGSDSSIMDDVCSIMTMSRWTLNERLKEEGTSFSELLKSIKLKIACNLLMNSSKSIQEISELVCFSSISAFSRFFTSNVNMSPLGYRKILSKND